MNVTELPGITILHERALNMKVTVVVYQLGELIRFNYELIRFNHALYA